MKRKFECKRSGSCCRDLLGITDGKEHGIYLTPEEAALFPDGTTVPLFRAQGKVFAYQNVSGTCPNLIEEGTITACRIYRNRPLVCRSFPVGYYGDDEKPTVSFGGCPCTSDYPDAEWDMTSFDSCFQAPREQVEQEATNPRATEMFILNGRKWVPL